LVDTIDLVWRSNGGAQGPYGPPAGGTIDMIEGPYRGVSVRFAGGGIFAWPGAPVIAMRTSDRLLASWIARGAPRSRFGWPSGAPVRTPDGRARAWPLTRGALFDVPTREVLGIHGAIHAYWLQLGALEADLGLPVAEQHLEDGEEVARFERGVLRWSPAGGVRRG
jgi:uncharacterized protein with LGFP repeats